jgi:hypothetical protein
MGYHGYEKIFDLLATLRVGIPDPLRFSWDIVAFFEANLDLEPLKAVKDPKGKMKLCEEFLDKSRLFQFDIKNQNQNPNNPKVVIKYKSGEKPPKQNQEIKATKAANNIQSTSDSSDAESRIEALENNLKNVKLEALQKNVSILNRDVQLEHNPVFTALRAEVATMKQDNARIQDLLHRTMNPVLDKLTQMSTDLDSLKVKIISSCAP